MASEENAVNNNNDDVWGLITAVNEIIFNETISLDRSRDVKEVCRNLGDKLRGEYVTSMAQVEEAQLQLEMIKGERDSLVEEIEYLRKRIESRESVEDQRESSRVLTDDACVDTKDLFPESSEAASLTTPALCNWLLQTPKQSIDLDSRDERSLDKLKANIFSHPETDQDGNLDIQKESVTSPITPGDPPSLAPLETSSSSVDVAVSSSQPNIHAINLQTWTEYHQEFSTPPYDMRSPVIAYLLSNWTSDTNKAMYLVAWTECLGDILPPGFPMGLQVVGLNTEVRDGFLMLIIPIMRHISKHPLCVYLRQSPTTLPADFDNWSTSSGNSPLYDIRVKVLAEPTRTSSTSSDAGIGKPGKWNPADYWRSSTDPSTLLSAAKSFDTNGSAGSSLSTSRTNSVSERLSSLQTTPSLFDGPRAVSTGADDIGPSPAATSGARFSSFTSSLLSSIVPTTWASKLGIGSDSNMEISSATANEDGAVVTSVTSISGADFGSDSQYLSESRTVSSEALPTSGPSTAQLVYTSLADMNSSGGEPVANAKSPVKVTGQQRADLIAAKLAALRKQ